MEVKGKKVLVFGLGISGIGAGQILERHGAEVIMYDGNQKLTEEKIKKQLGEDSSAKIVQHGHVGHYFCDAGPSGRSSGKA